MEKVYRQDSNDSISSGVKFESYLNNQPYLSLFLYQPTIRTRSISLNSNHSISILNKYYPKNSVYIFKGEILDTNKTFSDYNLQNNSIITIIPESIANTVCGYTNRLFQFTCDDSFQEKIYLNMNKNNKREIARIRDILLMKHELKKDKLPQGFQNDCKQINFNFQNDKSDTTINYEIKEPSYQPLPVLW